ncbi:hypothetical protein ACIOEX_20105 [Streptomyces sp. NPDC087850]|uniref:hypothetical protein n=1 Tax=Streptomyces sp. NPDC087850 TaxID=3365809 RepID=UPI00381A2C77
MNSTEVMPPKRLGFESRKMGFKLSREFGWDIPERFPDLDISEVDTDGVVLVVELGTPRSIQLGPLARHLIRAADGGIKTAVVALPHEGLVEALPLCNVWLMVDATHELHQNIVVEASLRKAG